jgi:hypothetical protein
MGQSMQCEQGDFRIIIWCGHVGKGLTLVDPDALITGYCVIRCPREGVTHSMPAVFFITHPDVAIDPSIPVADWPLNARGRARMQALAASPWASGVRHIFSSSERKARDAARLLADGLGLQEYSVVDALGENDRSATGYLAQQEFEATVEAFFAQPQTSARGWEPAADALTRSNCHLAALPISRRHEQPATNGGNWFAFDRVSRKLLHVGGARVTEGPFEKGIATYCKAALPSPTKL